MCLYVICLGSKSVPCTSGSSNLDSIQEDHSSTNKGLEEPKKKRLKRLYVYRGESENDESSSEEVEGNFFLL
jgi:hypothetical protein